MSQMSYGQYLVQIKQEKWQWINFSGGPHSPHYSAVIVLWHFVRGTLSTLKPTTFWALPLLVYGRLLDEPEPTLLTTNHPLASYPPTRNPEDRTRCHTTLPCIPVMTQTWNNMNACAQDIREGIEIH